jgi:heme-degrading monooxygenase HmoA
MFLRIARFKLIPGKREEAVNTYNERGVPRVRAFPGNVACYLLEPTVDGDDFLACTIWQTEEHARAYETSGAAAEVAALVRPAFAGAPELKSYRTRDS